MKQTLLFFSFILCFSIQTKSQDSNPGDKLEDQAKIDMGQKEFAKARYSYIQAYQVFAGQQNYSKAVDCGVQAATLYHRENLYKEAFNLCQVMDQVVATYEQSYGKQMPELHYKTNKVRFLMFLALKRPSQSKEYLDRIRELSRAAQNDSINDDYLYAQANYYYTFGMQQQGDETFNTLITKYKKNKQYSKVSDCYKKLIWVAQKAKNAPLVAQTYEKYIQWTNSARALTAKDELSVMKRQLDESQQTIQEKVHSLSVKSYIIVALVVVIAVLAAILVFGGIVLVRYIALNQKQKKEIQIANEQNHLKTKFIQNISAQLAPSLESLNRSEPSVQALLGFSEHIQVLGELEGTLTETYEMREIEASAFCNATIGKVKDKLKKGVSLTVDSPRQSIKSNPEQLERILLHLLDNAAEHTPEDGKIWLEFKKRGGHTHQFIVTNTGSNIAAEVQENLFKPFSEVRDLSKGDGLGLPICALIAKKMNGSLSLDTTYARGCRFVLELHS